MNESSHQKRYKSSSTSMSMALAEASIQSLLDFLRLNLWIWFDGFHKRGSLDKWKGRGGEGRRGGGLERIENEGEKIGNCVNNSLCEKCWAFKFDCQIGPFSYAKTKGYSQDNCHVSLFLFLFFFFHLHLLAWIHARQQLFYFGKLKKRSLGSCLVFTWLMHSNASLFAILPRKTPG